MKVYEGHLTGENVRIGIVVSRFNEFITSKLLGGALKSLGFPVLLRYRLLLPKWQTAENMMQLSHSVL